jgi:beta-fructofuranosidase
MYSGSGFSDWEIGDSTVIIHNGMYHLFHLIIPNHDYIAHAISRDGISWRRVNNALFVGNPGEWDDDMLWTMHVCEVGEQFHMYYTGLQRKDRGGISRIGFAESSNLVDWQKKTKNIFPIEPKGIFYEAFNSNPRRWLSFRDPFRFEYKGEVYLLICARSISGPVSRRGCVGLVQITNDVVKRLPPLLYPMMYDDIECPCVFELNKRFYIIGSIREDIKVRYWFAPEFMGEYHSFHDDVLLPQGNYAARTVADGDHLLIFNFFFTNGKINSLRVLPPPKELDTDERGRLLLKSYYRWELMVSKTFYFDYLKDIRQLLSNPTASLSIDTDKLVVGARSGYEVFTFQKPSASFIWEGLLTVEGMGKLGLVSDMDAEGNGYYISFDVANGLVQIRAWGFNPLDNKQNFIFNNLQAGIFAVGEHKSFHFKLIRYGHYIELSINGVIKLTLMDYTYQGDGLGLYSASSVISLQKTVLKMLPDPEEEYAHQPDIEKIEPQG